MNRKEKIFFVAMIYGIMAIQSSTEERIQIMAFILSGINAVLFIRED